MQSKDLFRSMNVDYRMVVVSLQNILQISWHCSLFFINYSFHFLPKLSHSLIYFVVMCILWTWLCHKSFSQSQFFVRSWKSQRTDQDWHLDASSSNWNTSEASILQLRKSKSLGLTLREKQSRCLFTKTCTPRVTVVLHSNLFIQVFPCTLLIWVG